VDGLERTLKSAYCQGTEFRELVVVDASKENNSLKARKITAKYANTRFMVQSTRGIYEAMNEGLESVSGDWVWFMNSGDQFDGPNTLEHVRKVIATFDAKVYVGGHTVLSNGRQRVIASRLGYAGVEEYAFERTQTNHQSTIYSRKALIEASGYDSKWRLCSDYASVISIANRGDRNPIYFFSESICVREAGGISDRSLVKVQWEKHRIRNELMNRRHLKSLGWFFAHLSHYQLKKFIGWKGRK